jgi:hypothetical protein
MTDSADPTPPPEDTSMEIHKPKPVHNWRELLIEIGIIVIGVAVALAAEQFVESLHWRNNIRDARRAMTLELRDDDGPQAYIRLAVAPCLDKQLDTIKTAIIAKGRRRDIERLIAGVKQANVTWDAVAWNTLQTSDVASHMTPEEVRNWSVPYVRIPVLDSVNLRENHDVVALQPSGLTSEVLTDSEADTMLAAIKRLRNSHQLMVLHSRSLLSGMMQDGVLLTPDQERHMLRDFRKIFGDCVVEPRIFVRNQDPYVAAASPP